MSDRSRLEAGSRMEPEALDLQAELSDEHWLLIADLFANPEPSPQGGRPRPIRGPVSKACCGCSAAVPAGKTCRRDSRRVRPSTADSSSGSAAACSTGRGNA